MTLDPSTDHSSPVIGTLADIDACTIDAAIVKIAPQDWPANLRRLGVSRLIAPGSQVEFSGLTSQNVSGSVLRTFLSSYTGPFFGQRVVADCFGTLGDSGSLLRRAVSKKGVGLCIGEIPDGSGGKEGIYQDLNQVKNYFKLDLFH